LKKKNKNKEIINKNIRKKMERNNKNFLFKTLRCYLEIREILNIGGRGHFFG